MNKRFFGLAGLCLCFLLSQAQPARSPHPRAARGHAIAQLLQWTPEQKAQLVQQQKTFNEQLIQLHQQDQLSVQEMRLQRQALVRNRRQDFLKLMDTRQRAIWDSLHQSRIERRNLAARQHLDKMKERLHLTPDQQDQIEKINNQFRLAMVQAHAEGDRLLVSSLRQTRRAQIQELLSPAQRQLQMQNRVGRESSRL